MLDGELARVGRGPGTSVNAAAVYRTPRGGITSTGFAALSVGMAKSVLAEWLGLAAPRAAGSMRMVQKAGNALVAAEASAEIEAAEALYFRTIRDSMQVLEAGGMLSDLDLLAARRNVAYACRTVVKAGSRLFNAAGAHALFNHQRIGQQYRNLLASGVHFAVSWDAHAPAYGQALLDRTAAKHGSP
jgi:hypothetical protein